jgi:hypothetical protein
MVAPLTPVIVVTLRNPLRRNRHVRVDGLVDTGSDISAIPSECAFFYDGKNSRFELRDP